MMLYNIKVVRLFTIFYGTLHYSAHKIYIVNIKKIGRDIFIFMICMVAR